MTDDRSNLDRAKVPPLSEEEKKAVASSDERSAAETKQIASGLSEQALRREAERTEAFRDHFERLALLTLYIAWGVLILIAMVWTYHLIAPPEWPRLPDDQVKQLQGIITGSILAGIIGGHMKRRLD